MFAKTIIDSDAFIEMPMSARLLYYDLGMRADDDGFVNAPKKTMRMIGCSDDDMKILITKKFIIPFESGVVVIKHWRINNYLRSDRYTETKYIEEKKMLAVDENGSYKSTLIPLGIDVGIPLGIPDGSQVVGSRDTQVSIGKYSIDKNNIYSQFFDSIWLLYPKKEGKGQVKQAQIKKLYDIGYERMKMAIEKYVKAKQGTDRQYLQNGSTFFNSGYIDYLEEDKPKEIKPLGRVEYSIRRD